MKFMEVAEDVIGPRNTEDDWRPQIVAATQEGLRNNGFDSCKTKWAQSYEAWAEATANFRRNYMRVGWSANEALLIQAMYDSYCANAIGKAVEQRSSRYAALTHAAYDALARKAREGEVAPKCYRSQKYLSEMDSGWTTILMPDDTGFRGFTANGPTVCSLPHPDYYSANGLREWAGGDLVEKDSDVVCFQSSAPDDNGLHSGVRAGPQSYMFPPLTMFKVISTEEGFELLPGKRVSKRLIIVKPTFMLSSTKEDPHEKETKMATNQSFLTYGNRKDSIRGLSDICANTVLTMRQEFARNETWREWNGNKYEGWEEYLYVAEGRAAIDVPGSNASTGKQHTRYVHAVLDSCTRGMYMQCSIHAHEVCTCSARFMHRQYPSDRFFFMFSLW
jgi:hypothetical protein